MAGFNSENTNGFHAGENGDAGDKTAGKVITCKAAVVWGPGEAFKMEEIEVEPPQRMEVRIRILFTSICHTDLSAWKGENKQQQVFPRVLGHEAAGVVESVGEAVEDLRPGDRVVPVFNGECGDCAACSSEKTNMCAVYAVDPMRSVMRADGRVRFFWVGPDKARQPVHHFLNTSTFAEYTVIDSACAVRVPADVPLSRMCLFSCGVSTGLGAAWNTANIEKGSKVAIFGLGAVGLAAAEGARLRGAARIIGVDINPNKFLKGREMGITDFINPKEYTKPSHEVIRELTDGGVDYSFECSGNLEVLREAYLSTHLGWGLTVVLSIDPCPRMLPIFSMELYERKIAAAAFGGFKPKSHLPALISNYITGETKINLDGFISHEMPFSEINQAFQLLSEGQALRCLLKL
ncbi:alcohol dehydrogenase-like 4 isoform X1 [Phalaenopsis equestris]|uniref:alcohol dehydrogenase-like 4 isoform X1 n=1 Tax=Phalaenopsis equestris TaxID=78828 RepID=UPI0009E1E0F5|nr:alcohol dehydrogenase-like 4 isoform X1 [Phalaenopsis equestris]